MEIRIHRDTTTPEAFADMIRLNVGDLLEVRSDIPEEMTFKELIKVSEDFKSWVLEGIRMSIYTSGLKATNGVSESFTMEDVQKVVLDDELIEKTFTIINDTTRADFIQYRYDLIVETQKEKPNFVEV